MSIEVLQAKIHRATVTEANLDYVGSITIDQVLLDATGLQEFQKVKITNLRNGIAWDTYIMAGTSGAGDICLNGPPAHHFQPEDVVIILGYETMEKWDVKHHKPIVVFVDSKNRVTKRVVHNEIKVGTIHGQTD